MGKTWHDPAQGYMSSPVVVDGLPICICETRDSHVLTLQLATSDGRAVRDSGSI